MTYLRHHMTIPLAPFHREIFRLTEEGHPLSVVVAFRGSGKSTIVALSSVIWAAVTGRKKFILVISKTEAQAKLILYNIKAELESNPHLIRDFGPFNVGDVWNESSLVLPRQKARIVALSADSALRGFKNHANRPDFIILDDVEAMDSVRSSDVREKRYRWLKSEVIPAGSDDCAVFIVGNLLHEDSLVSRLAGEIEKGELIGVYRQFAIVKDDKPTWPAKFPDMAAIEALKRRIGDQRAFRREYMQEVVADADQPVLPEWIHTYKELPYGKPGIEFAFAATGIDVAASMKESSDCMALVTAYVFHDTRESRGETEDGYEASSDCLIYIAPVCTNDHLSLQGLINRAKYHRDMIGKSDHRFYLEDAGTQILCLKPMKDENLRTEAVKTDGMDKRSRLMLAARLMETGRVFFPETGAEETIKQILGFPRERHDDLVDAFSLLCRKASEQASYRFGIWFL